MTDIKDSLPSWQEGKAKQRIIEFVRQVSDQQSLILLNKVRVSRHLIMTAPYGLKSRC